ncbi:MAG: efflux RND transporter permease subunit [Pirellulales bacterium]
MFTTWFVKNPRLLVMTIVLIVIAGVSSFTALPRMEDPILTARFGLVTTVFPGATPERVETLVSKNIEKQLADIKEIREVTAINRSGVSVIVVELNEELQKDRVSTTWGVVRERLTAAHALMPEVVTKPKLKELDAKANAMLVAVRWESDQPPSYSILRRLASRLQDRMDQVQGTEKSDMFGDPREEFVVQVERERANSLGISAAQIAQIISGNDTKLPAGRIQAEGSGLTLEVLGNLDTQTLLSQIPIRRDKSGSIVELGDIASISRCSPDPAPAKAFASGKPAIIVGAQLEDKHRIDIWRKDAQQVLDQFQQELPSGVGLEVIFDQYPYVEQRFLSLEQNFVVGLLSVFLCTVIWMNLRSAIIVGAMLPLNCLLIMPLMMIMNIPLHQMSVSGLVIAMGMLVDNAIVVVDHIEHKVSHGMTVRDAALDAAKFLMVPLIGATLTTVFSFAPIALMPGATGEFVGSIAMVTMITVALSYILSLTVIPGISLFVFKPSTRKSNWLTNPFGISANLYRMGLRILLRFPIVGAMVTASTAIAGLFCFFNLEDQFFPPADRDQFHIELDLSANASMNETQRITAEIREVLLSDPGIEEVHWFIGESSPIFYYNVATVRSNQPSYGQAIVKCRSASEAKQAMLRLQPQLVKTFPEAIISVRQLEQGPPFTAPIEVRLTGPDIDRLRDLASEVRVIMSSTKGITHTRSESSEIITKGKITVDQTASYMAGYDLTTITASLNSSLDGMVGGTILEGTEEIPVRVRLNNKQRGDLNEVASIELQGFNPNESSRHQGIPLSAITRVSLSSDVGSITRVNRIRCAEIHGFLPTGVLPSIVQNDFKQRLAKSDFVLPNGYDLQFLGAAGEQQQALGNLSVYATVMGAALVATLVVGLNSFRLAALVGLVSMLSVGYSLAALDWLDLPFGFMAIIGIVGMLGVAVNDSILIVTSISLDSEARQGDKRRIIEIAVENSRHVLVTSITTIAGFLPLYMSGGEFWPPTAICVSMGVAGSTFLALFFVPCGYLALNKLPQSELLSSQLESN